MKVEVLGCFGNVSGKYRTTSFLINDFLLLDCGTVTEVLEEKRIGDLKFILLSHTHIDHVKGLFPLLDGLVSMERKQIEVISEKRIIELVSQNYLNNYVWPDFTSIPSKDDAILRLRSVEEEEDIEIEDIHIRIIPVNHTVYTVGFMVKEKGKGFMFTADTGRTEKFFETAKKENGIEFIIADVSYPERLKGLAEISGHMTLSMLLEHIERFNLQKMPIYISHMKPPFVNEILEEIAGFKNRHIKPLKQDSVIII